MGITLDHLVANSVRDGLKAPKAWDNLVNGAEGLFTYVPKEWSHMPTKSHVEAMRRKQVEEISDYYKKHPIQ